MKILLAGLGSIGKRHLRNILSFGYNDVSIVSRSGVLPDEFQQLKVFSSIETALLSSNFDAAIICTPTSKHVEDLSAILSADVKNIYIEKPISHSLEAVDMLLGNFSFVDMNIVVGYDLHFDPGFEKVKELLSENIIGNIVSINAQVGQYLPDWRPHEDYRKGMSAKKETGGGVMLDLIHEFDYLYQLCGRAEAIAAMYRNSATLEIETEDVAEVLIQFESGCLGTIHLDYLQQKLVRNCLITGQHGSIFWNLAESRLSWVDSQKNEQTFGYKTFERNDRFVNIMKAFLEGKDDERLTSFEDGAESLKMVIASKKSAETKSFIKLSSLQTSNNK